MAKVMTLRSCEPVTLATTVTRLTVTGPRVLCLFKATTSTVVYVVTDGTADAGALPATGRIPILASAMPIEIDVSGYGPIGLAGDVAGSVEAMLR